MNPAQPEGSPIVTTAMTPDASSAGVNQPPASPGILGGLRSKLNVLTGGQASDGSQPAPEPGSTTSWPLSKPVQPGTPPYHEEVSAFATTPETLTVTAPAAEPAPPALTPEPVLPAAEPAVLPTEATPAAPPAIPEPAPGAVVEPAVSPVWPTTETGEQTPAQEPNPTSADKAPLEASNALVESINDIRKAEGQPPLDVKLTGADSSILLQGYMEYVLNHGLTTTLSGLPETTRINTLMAANRIARAMGEKGDIKLSPSEIDSFLENARQKGILHPTSQSSSPTPPAEPIQNPPPAGAPEPTASEQYGPFPAITPQNPQLEPAGGTPLPPTTSQVI